MTAGQVGKPRPLMDRKYILYYFIKCHRNLREGNFENLCASWLFSFRSYAPLPGRPLTGTQKSH